MVKPSIPEGKTIICDYCWDVAGVLQGQNPLMVGDHYDDKAKASAILFSWGWLRPFATNNIFCPVCVKNGHIDTIPWTLYGPDESEGDYND